MKKQLVGIICLVGILILGSCTEKGPAIDFSNVKSVDTTYTITPEASELRRILVEEATGVRCSNCPAGAKIIKDASAANPGRIIVVGLHYNVQTAPLPESKYAFADSTIKDLFKFFNGEPNKPAAVFDRTLQGGKYFLDNRTAWPNIISTRLQLPTPVKLSMTSSYNPATHEDTIRIRVSYTGSVTKKQSIMLLITENDIEDAQEDGVIIVEDYVHEHVFREFITPYSGSSFLDSLTTKEPGRVYERTFIYKLPEEAFGDAKIRWNLDNCNVIGFVFNNELGDYEVAQAMEIPLK